jgi:hypothetical protein
MCGSEAFFDTERFAPFQLPELSVKEFMYLLSSSLPFCIGNILPNELADCKEQITIAKTVLRRDSKIRVRLH